MQGFQEKASGQADIPSLIPFERWAIERAYAPEVTVGKMYVRFAGFLPSVEAFDASAFRWACLTTLTCATSSSCLFSWRFSLNSVLQAYLLHASCLQAALHLMRICSHAAISWIPSAGFLRMSQR